jgi:hypothetical protein
MTIEVGQPTANVFLDIRLERIRQETIGARKRAEGIDWRSCADPDMPGGDATRFAVLGEEVGEVARAHLEAGYDLTGRLGDVELRAELVQVAAVAVAWVEAIDARTGNGS